VISMASTLGPSAYWYLARSTGAVALVLLTVSVVLGILDTLRFSAAPRWPRFAVDAIHRQSSLLVIVFIVVHIITSVLDGFAPISLIDGVIPFHSPYRPLWLGLGVVSFDLLIALAVTSLLRRRIGYGWWRGIHWLAYASWPVAVLHGLGTGTDVKSVWMLGLTAVCVAAVLAALLIRISDAGRLTPGLRSGATLLAVGVPLGMVVFALAGPLQKGWARRAGTPARLLGAVHVTSHVAPAARTPVSESLDRAFSASLFGTVTQSTAPDGAVIELGLRLGGQVNGQLRVRMGGAPLPGGGLSLTGSQVDLTGPGLSSAMTGKILSLQGDTFLARVKAVSGSALDLQANLSIDQNSGNVTGTLTGKPVTS
jgi:methionine sulfoxide reductase heme-binding subunit